MKSKGQFIWMCNMFAKIILDYQTVLNNNFLKKNFFATHISLIFPQGTTFIIFSAKN